MSQDKNKSILVVDDDPYILESTSMMIREFGYNVVACNSVKDALDQMNSIGFTLV